MEASPPPPRPATHPKGNFLCFCLHRSYFGCFYFYFFRKITLYESESGSHSVVSVSDCLRLHGLYSPWNSPGQNTGVDSLSLLQGICSTQRLNPGLPHCRWILYQLSHKRSPYIFYLKPTTIF